MTYPKLKPLKKDVVVDSTSGRLELVAQFNLHGIISTMGTVRTNSSRGKEGCDSLLLGFSDAKVRYIYSSRSCSSCSNIYMCRCLYWNGLQQQIRLLPCQSTIMKEMSSRYVFLDSSSRTHN